MLLSLSLGHFGLRFNDTEYDQEHILKSAIPLAANQRMHKVKFAFLAITSHYIDPARQLS